MGLMGPVFGMKRNVWGKASRTWGVRPQLNHPDDKLSRSATRMPLLIDGRAMDGAAAL